ncbi:glycosyltransferase [Pseudomonas alkylphenolica]|uniref:glycosyltransferase n=1 Tax=Pseudomonas alkylphenolica TaxID=237609 RepID=UPI0018D6DBB1|nr:glycosyltransferase [Pseudomonas alkylphenolica]MBH3428772.1 glycosyltransferase [Pseudomonas alkylphenolica]
MKILHFYKTFAADQHGGVEHFIRHLTHATSSLGCENTILSLAREPSAPLVTPEYRLFQVKESANFASTGMSVSAFSAFSSLAAEADIIHYHFPWPFMDLVHFVTRVGKPSVVTYHSDIVRQRLMLPIYRPLMNMFLRSVSAIAGTSPNYLQSSRVLKQFRDKSLAIPIGLQESLYPAARASTTAELKARFGERFFLFVGVLRYYKGLHFLLQALKNTDLPLVIVGAGPIEHELREEATRLGLTHVHFIGQVTEQEKVDLFNACYAVVFPSHLRSEAFGISLLEGAMFGKPMICSEIGTGTSFINQHEVTGLVVPPADAQALKAAMLRLWEDAGEAARFGVAARQRFLQVFTAQVMGEAYRSLYTSLVR